MWSQGRALETMKSNQRRRFNGFREDGGMLFLAKTLARKGTHFQAAQPRGHHPVERNQRHHE
jgi:hypothetical protein